MLAQGAVNTCWWRRCGLRGYEPARPEKEAHRAADSTIYMCVALGSGFFFKEGAEMKYSASPFTAREWSAMHCRSRWARTHCSSSSSELVMVMVVGGKERWTPIGRRDGVAKTLAIGYYMIWVFHRKMLSDDKSTDHVCTHRKQYLKRESQNS